MRRGSVGVFAPAPALLRIERLIRRPGLVPGVATVSVATLLVVVPAEVVMTTV